MGFKDLQVLVLLVGLCLGHTFKTGAQVGAPGVSVPAQANFSEWSVSPEKTTYTILQSINGTFSFDLLLTNQSKSSCAAAVRHTSSNTSVWVANFNDNNSNSTIPVRECFLNFTQAVGLVLKGRNYDKEIWSTNLSSKASFDTLQLEETGCLYIKDKYQKDLQKSVWKSFDYPADTLVKGQKLWPGMSMSAAQLNQIYSTGGIFSMRIDGSSMTLFQDFKANGVSRDIPYKPFSNPPKNNKQNITYVQMENSLLAFYGTANMTLSSTVNGSDNWDYARLEFSGGLVLKNYNGSGGQIELVGNGDSCLLPADCGSFGICSSQNSTCRCPDEGFTQASNTCERLPFSNMTSLSCTSDTKLVNITGQTYLNVSDLSPGDVKNITRTDCEERCFGNCSCNIALHVKQDVLNPLGACFLNLDSMQTIRQGVDSSSDLQMLFLRIPLVILTPSPPSPSPSVPGTSSRRTAASAFAGGAGALVLVLLAVSAWWLVYTRRKYFGDAERGVYDSAGAGSPPSQLPPRYTYEQLVASTSNFAQRLGYGGHSSVYAGILPDNSTKIAVKKLDDKGHKDKDFLAAVAIMGSVSHPNLVPLVGYCKEGKHKMLVYELVNEGRSLNWFLFNMHDSGTLIDASTRRSIALGTARGLQRLHEDYNTGGVTHGGVKPENIMIDRGMHPKLVDYGLLHLSSRFVTLQSAETRGARGYMAPESRNSAPLTGQADVYSLGVVILELVSGRRCLIPDLSPEEKRYLPAWGFSILSRGNNDLDSVLELADSRLDIKASTEIDQQVLKGMTFVALWCVQGDPALRPSMDEVVRMLEGDQTVNVPPLSPALDAYARELCASQQGVEQQGFMHSPSVSENSDMQPSAFCCPRMETENSRRDHTWLLQT